jgi:hypothetical protein
VHFFRYQVNWWTLTLWSEGPSSVEEIGSPTRDSLLTAAAPSSTSATAETAPNNVLSIFSPQVSVSRIAQAETPQFAVPRPLSSVSQAALSDISNLAMPGAQSTALTTAAASDAAHSAVASMDLIDDDLPLLNDTDHYPFSEGEEVCIFCINLGRFQTNHSLLCGIIAASYAEVGRL